MTFGKSVADGDRWGGGLASALFCEKKGFAARRKDALVRSPALFDGACAGSIAENGIDAACAGGQGGEGTEGVVVEGMFDHCVSCEAVGDVKSAIWLAPPRPGTIGPRSSSAS